MPKAPEDVKDGDLAADYRAAGFGGTLGMPRNPALLVIDMCLAYLAEDAPLYAGIEAERANIRRLLAAFRAAGRPVVHTRVEYMPGGADGGLFFRKVAALACFERGNPLACWPDDLAPKVGEVIVTKQYASAFFGTSLASTLTAMGIDGVMITGVSTSGCVRASTLDALQNGFLPIVVEDACGDRDRAVHDANIFDLQAKYADLATTDAVIAELDKTEPGGTALDRAELDRAELDRAGEKTA